MGFGIPGLQISMDFFLPSSSRAWLSRILGVWVPAVNRDPMVSPHPNPQAPNMKPEKWPFRQLLPAGSLHEAWPKRRQTLNPNPLAQKKIIQGTWLWFGILFWAEGPGPKGHTCGFSGLAALVGVPRSSQLMISGVEGLGVYPQAQRAQYPLIKEYTLNHNIKAPRT